MLDYVEFFLGKWQNCKSLFKLRINYKFIPVLSLYLGLLDIRGHEEDNDKLKSSR